MMRPSRRAFLALPLACPAMAAASLTVVVTGLRGTAGQVVVALHATPASFPSRFDAAEMVQRVPAVAPETVLRLTAPAPGRYALIALHDEDGNGAMTKTLIGLPREGYGAPGGETLVIPLWYPA